MAFTIAGSADREHHRHFDEDAHHRRKRRARVRTKERDRRGYRLLHEQHPEAQQAAALLARIRRRRIFKLVELGEYATMSSDRTKTDIFASRLLLVGLQNSSLVLNRVPRVLQHYLDGARHPS